jgi:hypothetical protein
MILATDCIHEKLLISEIRKVPQWTFINRDIVPSASENTLLLPTSFWGSYIDANSKHLKGQVLFEVDSVSITILYSLHLDFSSTGFPMLVLLDSCYYYFISYSLWNNFIIIPYYRVFLMHFCDNVNPCLYIWRLGID